MTCIHDLVVLKIENGLKIKIHIVLTKFNVLIRVQTDNSQSNMISFDVEITSAT